MLPLSRELTEKGVTGVLHRPPATDEVLLAVGARGDSELPAETAGEVELVIEAAGVGYL